MALYRGSTKLAGIGKVPGTEYMSQCCYDALPSSKLTDGVNRGIYECDEDLTLTKFIKNGVEYCLGGGSSTKYGFIHFLAVGGGGGGGYNYGGYFRGGGGGAGGYVEDECFAIAQESYCVVVGAGGGISCNGGNSCMGGEIAYGGGRGGGAKDSSCWIGASSGGSGGGGCSNCNWNTVTDGGSGCQGQGNNGGQGCKCVGGGGGGAGGAGCSYNTGGCGGIGKCSCISGECIWYSGGGKGYGASGTDACGKTGCGGGGDYNSQGNPGVVIIRYHTDGSDKILPVSTGGCKYTCGDYTIHCFTSNGTFTPFYK